MICLANQLTQVEYDDSEGYRKTIEFYEDEFCRGYYLLGNFRKREIKQVVLELEKKGLEYIVGVKAYRSDGKKLKDWNAVLVNENVFKEERY